MVVPVLFGFPAMFFPVPPLVILIPASLPFGIQIAPGVFGFSAVFAVVVDCLVQSRLRFFDCVLAMGTVIGVGLGRGGDKPHKRCGDKGCYSGFLRIFCSRLIPSRFYARQT